MLPIAKFHEDRHPLAGLHPHGVVSGCQVSLGSGMRLSVSEGKVCTANGVAGELVRSVPNAAVVPEADSVSRWDYLVAHVEHGGMSFRYHKGVNKPGSHLTWLS